ncbi:MAG: heparinase II/III family protein [Alphaproteobacteria bacterium]|nr:heparinase II/III family protein [Alphaproteobacteria bacterium]
MNQAAKIIGKVRRGVQNVAYGNKLYQKFLAAGETPMRLHFAPPDPWPGDASAGMALLSEQRSMFPVVEEATLRNTSTTLRNLRAVGTDAAREMCARLIDRWLEQFDGWDKDEWLPEHLGARIAAWIGFYDFYAPVASSDFVQRLVTSLHRQWKHLERTMSPSLKGVEAVQAARGLIYGGLNFPEGDNALGFACDLLQRQLAAEILADGGHVSRNPSAQMRMLAHLVDIQNVLTMAGIAPPPSIGTSVTSLVPGLKLFRHGDGGLALFHGSAEEVPLMIDAILTQAVIRGRVVRRLPETGYERLQAGRSLLIADAASPPPRAYGTEGHAGLLSFEFSSGRERLIVNCGSAPHASAEWRSACAATAAHSTLTVADTNACEIDGDGSIAGSVMTSTHRFEQNGAHYLEMAHNGYYARFGLTHTRAFQLSADGDTLLGRDALQGKKARPYTLRWHLHPTVQVSLSQGGQTALLRTPSGAGWKLRVEKGQLGLESSIYCGGAVPRRTMQVKLTDVTSSDDTVVTWTLARERKA